MVVVGDGEGHCFGAGFDSAGTGGTGDNGDAPGEEGVDHETGPFDKKAQIDVSSCQTGQRSRTPDRCNFALVAIRLCFRSLYNYFSKQYIFGYMTST